MCTTLTAAIKVISHTVKRHILLWTVIVRISLMAAIHCVSPGDVGNVQQVHTFYFYGKEGRTKP